MPLSLAKFQALTIADQLGTVLSEGTYLATRYQDEDTINLYSLGSFYVEVFYDPEINHLHGCQSFTSTLEKSYLGLR